MDRIRAGLTGLAAVFLVTAAASLLFAPDEADRIAAEQQEPGEPLAQLGVAPGSDKGAGAGGAEGGGAESGGDGASGPGADPALPAPEAQPSGGLFEDGTTAAPALPTPAESLSGPLRDLPVAI
jgi:hypothetical protein